MNHRVTSMLVCAFSLASAPAFAHGGKVLSEIPSPVAEPMGLAVHEGLLWISDLTTRSVVSVDPNDGKVVSRFDAPGFMPTGIAWSGDTLFLADRRLDAIARLRPGAAGNRSPIPYYERWATGMAHDGSRLWVIDAREAKLHELDPDDGTTIASFATPDDKPTGLAFDGRFLWVADHGKDSLYRVDRKNGAVITVLPSPGPYPNALAVDGDTLWVADYEKRVMSRVALPNDTPFLEDDPRRVHASFEVAYRARGPGAISNLVAFVALPRAIPGQHPIGELAFDPAPARIVKDRWEQPVAVFELGNLPSGETRTVRWSGDFDLFRVRFHLDPDRIEAAKLPADLDPYLADDKKYDIRSDAIGDLVDTLTKKQTTYYGRARAIYDHLTEVITYDRSGGWNNAAAVLKRGTGSCSEYTFALVALLRRAGIPARYVGAISERGDQAGFDDVFHRWAEVYMPGYGWVPVDANAGHGASPGDKGHSFGGRSNRHVVTTLGGGASEYLDWTYNNFETYDTTGRVELQVNPIARYRPRETGAASPASTAPRVLAPVLTEPVGSAGGRLPTARADGERIAFGDPWIAGIALLIAGGIGLAVGRGVKATGRS